MRLSAPLAEPQALATPGHNAAFVAASSVTCLASPAWDPSIDGLLDLCFISCSVSGAQQYEKRETEQ